MMTPVEQNLRSLICSGETAYIFDFDGTISDTFFIHESGFKRALAGYPVRFEYKDYLGQTTGLAIAQIFRDNKIPVDDDELKRIVHLKRQYANESILTDSKFIGGADEFLNILRKKDVSMFVASSGSKLNVWAGLETLGIRDYFKGVITADDITHSKPHPEIYEITVSRFNLNKSKTLVIEDALSGIEAALMAGLQVICINPEIDISPFSGQAVTSYSFPELINLTAV
jgi:beta-phosphoglucomutase